MKEIWKDIKGYERFYQISNMGRVRSLARIIYRNYDNRIVKQTFKERILKIIYSNQGYGDVKLSIDGKLKTFRIHNLVANAFLKFDLDRKHINHIDGDKKNNKLTNLERVSPMENVHHSIRIGLTQKPIGKKIYSIDKNGDKEYFNSIAEAKRKYNNSGIGDAVRGKTNFSCGLRWGFI